MPDAPSPLSTRRREVFRPRAFSRSKSSLATLSSHVPLPIILASCDDNSSPRCYFGRWRPRTVKRLRCPGASRLAVVRDCNLLHRLALPRGAHLLRSLLEVLV